MSPHVSRTTASGQGFRRRHAEAYCEQAAKAPFARAMARPGMLRMQAASQKVIEDALEGRCKKNSQYLPSHYLSAN